MSEASRGKEFVDRMGWRFVVRFGWALVLGIAAAGALPAQTKYVTEGDTWRYFKGTEAPPTDWKEPGFVDSDWLEGATPIGYGTDLPHKTVLSDMQQVTGGAAGYLSVFSRIEFDASSVSEVKLLRLKAKYDDGFVAYLNGAEIARSASMGTSGSAVAFDAASADHETNTTFQDFLLPCEATPLLRDGTNVLAVQGHNTNLTSSDFSMSVELESVTQVCPLSFRATVPSAKTSIQVSWQRPVGIVYETLTLLRNGVEVSPQPAISASLYTDRSPIVGENRYELTITLCETVCNFETSILFEGAGVRFRRGDTNGDAVTNITDGVALLNHLFRGGDAPACPDSADTNDDAVLNITDAVYLLQALFQGGPQPAAPGPDACGTDPTEDTLETCVYEATSC